MAAIWNLLTAPAGLVGIAILLSVMLLVSYLESDR